LAVYVLATALPKVELVFIPANDAEDAADDDDDAADVDGKEIDVDNEPRDDRNKQSRRDRGLVIEMKPPLGDSSTGRRRRTSIIIIIIIVVINRQVNVKPQCRRDITISFVNYVINNR
jgi:hypothetical protein